MRTKNIFNKRENIVLTEIERRLRYFENDLNTNLLVLLLPSEAKKLKTLGYIMPSNTETPRSMNWYRLDKKGVDLFSKIDLSKMSEEENTKIFDGSLIKNYNKLV
jgi:hypothetical protein